MDKLYFKALRPGAKMGRGRTEDAGFDLFLNVPDDLDEQEKTYCDPLDTDRFKKDSQGWFINLRPGQRLALPSGIATSCPKDIVLTIKPRSGLAYKYGIDTMAGVIDSGYTNEIRIILINHGKDTLQIKDGDKLAQLVPHKLANFDGLTFEQVDELPESDRGKKGFGSSGIK